MEWNSGARNLVPLLDQGLASGANMLCIFAVSRIASTFELGIFVLGYTSFTVFMALSRGWLGLSVSLADESQRAIILMRGFGQIVAATPIMMLVIGLATWLPSATDGQTFAIQAAAALAIGGPLTLLQDLYRYFLIAEGRWSGLLVSDGVRAAVLVLAFFLGPVLGVAGVLALWVVAPCLSLVVAVSYVRIPSNLAAVLRSRGNPTSSELKSRSTRIAVGLSSLLSSGTTLLAGSLISIGLGPQTLGILRGAAALFGPINVLISFIDIAVLPRYLHGSPKLRAHLMRFAFMMLTGSSIVLSGLLLILPARVGSLLLGETWGESRLLLPYLALEYLMLGLLAVLLMVLKASHGRGRAILLNKVATSLLLMGVVILAVQGGWGTISIQLGYALVALIGLTLGWLAVHQLRSGK